ncbi:two-component system response regulator [Colwellia sp. 75C3]|uniref:HD domain-containing phosphohydrolase n=1 Tax=Colwellia sp. 75C3 TaxID=888425 RepID=UPI000C32B87A|nr:HD domain-containing phosphohydrolase [Colwellia sp. 75C3]PKG80834.1 two-component system response regulator [Colwellia sp. 75C3]
MYKNKDSINILICDDSVTNTLILSTFLNSEGYVNTTILNDPEQVSPTLSAGNYHCLFLDIEMPKMNGFQVMNEIIGNNIVDEFFPIIVMTGLQTPETRNRALAEGASDFITKPFDQTEALLRFENVMKIYFAYSYKSQANIKLTELTEQRTKELLIASEILIDRLAKAGEYKDSETGQHVLRVGQYAKVLAEALYFPSELCFLIEKSAPLHDLGKIGISDAILLKKGKLTVEEMEEMKEHTKIGANLLEGQDSLLIKMAASIALSHHENWDGSGYPYGLRGEAIPIEGRITAIADVFDALTTKRPYKDAWSIEKTVAEIKSLAGIKFDQNLVDLFLANLDKFESIRQDLADPIENQKVRVTG